MSFENAMPVDMFLLDTIKNVVLARRTKVTPVECPRWFPVRLFRNDKADPPTPLLFDGGVLSIYDLVGFDDYLEHSARFALWYVEKYFSGAMLSPRVKAVNVANWICVRCVDGVPVIPYVAEHRHDAVMVRPLTSEGIYLLLAREAPAEEVSP
jgi:hypothetical protein